MKLGEITKENLVATLSHQEFRAKADLLARKKISGSVSPSQFQAALKAAMTAADPETVAAAIIASIHHQGSGKMDMEATKGEVTHLCMRGLEAAINRGLATS